MAHLVLAGVAWIMAAQAPPSADEVRKAFAWFDALDYPDLSKAKFVRVTTGWWSQMGKQPPKNSHRHAFLISEHGDQFTVFTLDVDTIKFTKTPADAPPHLVVAWEPADLARVAGRLAEELHALPKKPDLENRDAWDRLGDRWGGSLELFVLARACEGQGHGKLSKDLITLAAYPAYDQPLPLLTQVSRIMASERLDRALESMKGPYLSRPALSAEFRRIEKLAPGGFHAAEAKGTADLLDRMIREDEARDREPRRPWSQLTASERAADLVHQLRDQAGAIYLGSVDSFWNQEGREDSPADQLIALGLDAVPALLEALENKRYTRAVAESLSSWRVSFREEVLRVCDVARSILENIAGLDFEPRADESQDAENRPTVQSLVRRWWDEVQRKGEKRVLIEGTGVPRVDQAELLARKYPDAALEAIRRGVRSAESSWEVERLIGTAATLKDEAALGFLREQMKTSPWESVRVAAARDLWRAGSLDSVAEMIALWVKTRDEGATRELIEFLACCESRDALVALGTWTGRLDYDRENVIEILGDGPRYPLRRSKGGKEVLPGERADGTENPELMTEIEAILVRALDEKEETLADLAAGSLSERWPKRYAFDKETTDRARRRQRVVLKNTWRTARGMAPVPLPEERTQVYLDAKEVEPLVRELMEAESAFDQRVAAGQLVRKGTAAVRAVVEILKGLPAESKERTRLEPVAARLGSVVEELTFETNGLDPGENLKKAVEALRGKPLEEDDLVELVLMTCAQLPPGVGGLRVTGVRDGDLTGVRVKVTLLPARKKPGLNPNGWDYVESVSSGSESLAGCSGVCIFSAGLEAGHFDYFEKAAAKALAAPPTTPFQFRLSQLLDPKRE